jgi:Protein of unknown function (DUF1631)
MATQAPPTRAQLAAETRKRFVTEAGRAMTDISAAVQSHLTSLMNESARLREAQSRRDAWTVFQKARGVWLDGTMKAWQLALDPPLAPKSKNLTEDSFQLVDTAVVDNKIVASRLVRGTLDKLSAQIDDLKIRMRVLEGRAEFEDHDVLRPEVIMLPVVEQWFLAGMQRDSWPMVHDVVQRMLAERLLTAYTQCNEQLIKHGVLPTIELKDRVKRIPNTDPGQSPRTAFRPSSQPEAQGSTFGIDSGNYVAPVPHANRPGFGTSGPAQLAGQRPQGNQGNPGGQGARSEGAFGGRLGYQPGHPQGGQREAGNSLQPRNSGPQNMAAQSSRSNLQSSQPSSNSGPGQQGYGHSGQQDQQGYGGAHEETRMLTSTTPLARARSRAQGVMGQLKRLLVGRVGPEAEISSYGQAGPSPALAAAIAVRPRVDRGGEYGDGGTVIDEYTPAGVAKVAGRLREETTELKKKAETKGEKAIIEIVALMFQSILQEERIPPGIRVWFARLQMPVLRVALEEPDFFGTLNHPARQLIDRMGSCVMGFDASGLHGHALEGEVKRIVQVIEQYPETGKRVYQLVYEEFQKFLAKFLTEKGPTQKVVSVAQQVEQKETLTIQYTIEMRNMLRDMPVRDEIREFLFKVWAEVLAVAAVRKGPQHLETIELKKSASDLVWSAGAKPNRTDRARVIAELPKLLQRLRSGMSLLGLAPSQQDAHIKTVSDTLADAFLSKTKAVPQDQIDAMAKRLANLEDFVSEDGMGDLPLDSESIELMLGIDASTIEVVADGGSKPTNAMTAWAAELQLGAWFTLDHNGRVAQVQFAWRSERKHLNLFATTEGYSYLIQAGRLAAYLQAGLLLPQEEDTLTVRATRDALAKLEANPERLLG